MESLETAALLSLFISLSAIFSSVTFHGLKLVAGALLWPYTYFKGLSNAWLFLILGPQQIDRAYLKAKGQPFEVKAPDHKCVFISSEKQVKEIDSAPQDTLSLFAATKQMFQPQYTMHGFNWVDRRGQDGIGYVRALRSLLTAHLPQILPDLRSIIEHEITNSYNTNSKTINGVKHFPAFDELKRIVVKTNGFAFFGRDLVSNQEFMDAAFDNIEHVIWASEWIRVMPTFLAPYIGKFLSSRTKTQETWYSVLKSDIERRLEYSAPLKDGKRSKDHPNDGIQWIMDTSPKNDPWSAGRIVHEMMALWFGSIHGLSITATYALFDLCLHPEYVEPLRKELESVEYRRFAETAVGLPLLDSFVKESARMHPMDSMTSRRQALKQFTFSDGTRVDKGDWTCVPMRPMLHDPKLYPSPHTFNGFRFTDLPKSSLTPFTQPEGPSKLTDVSYEWGMWGNTRMACPARFHAVVVIKLILAHILMNYDCDLADKDASLSATWRSYILPRGDLLVRLKPRN